MRILGQGTRKDVNSLRCKEENLIGLDLAAPVFSVERGMKVD